MVEPAPKTVPPQHQATHPNEAKDSGIAVVRELFEKGPNWDLEEYKKTMLSDKQVEKLPDLHFLNGKDTKVEDTVVMTSYPRSGNTLLRATLEKVMGLVTGSDCNINLKLNQELMEMGLAGEGLVDKKVWIVKTHYPERYASSNYDAQRAILLVRSPLDALTSLFHMLGSGSHDVSMAEEEFVRFDKLWMMFIEQEATVWKDFHDYWLKLKIPIHIIRYEDIKKHPKESITDLMKFVFKKENLENTMLQRIIEIATKQDAP